MSRSHINRKMVAPGKKASVRTISRRDTKIEDIREIRTKYLGLHSAAREGRLDDLRDMIRKGIHPHGRDSCKRTPAMIAAEFGRSNIMEYYASGDDLREDQEKGQSALRDLDVVYKKKIKVLDEGDNKQPYDFTLHMENYDKISRREGDGFMGYRGWDPMRIAAKKGDADVVKVLVKYTKYDSKYKKLVNPSDIDETVKRILADGHED